VAKHPFLPEGARRAVRRRPGLQRAVWWVEASIVRLLWGLCALLPPDRATALGGALGRRVGPRTGKADLVRENLARALPALPEAARDALASEVWWTWGAMLAELPHLVRIDDPAEGRLEVVVAGDVRALREPDRPAVFVTAHMANWQVATQAAARLGCPLTAVYTPDSNPFVDRAILRYRRGLRCRLVPRDGSARALMRELAAGRSVGIVADHRVDQGASLPFFGIPTLVTTVPARLALRFDAELVPMRVERLRGARFRVTFEEPVRAEDPSAPARAQAERMTRALLAVFERWAVARPDQWICVTRRWPKERRRSRGEDDAAAAPGRDAAKEAGAGAEPVREARCGPSPTA
jgi:KDO2-lipid IV(A) lauroyltransferase